MYRLRSGVLNSFIFVEIKTDCWNGHSVKESDKDEFICPWIEDTGEVDVSTW